MKKITTILFCLSSLIATSQKDLNLYFGIGVERLDYSTNEQRIRINGGEVNNVNLTFDWFVDENYGLGLELTKSLPSDVNLFEGIVKGGYIINGNKRIQFPIYVYLGFYSMQEEDLPKYGNFSIGAQGGMRFYLTNKFAIQAMYNIKSYGADSEDGQQYDESLGSIGARGIRIGFVYYWSNK